MSSLLGRLQNVGELHARGEFTLDVEKAGSKLSRFQFPDEADFLYQLVAALFHLRATEIRVVTRGGELELEIPKLTLDPTLPRDLDQFLLEEHSPWRRLAAATQAILAHSPEKFLWLGSQKNQSYDYLEDESQNWKSVALTKLEISGLPSDLLRRAQQRLQKAATFCTLPLVVNGLRQPPPSPTSVLLPGQKGWCWLDPGEKQARLHLVVDQMSTEVKVLDLPLPWVGVAYWDPPQAQLDASLSSVVENEAYQNLLKRIPETYEAAFNHLIRSSQRVEEKYRNFFLDRLAEQESAQLAPLRLRTQELKLFQDLRQVRWSLKQLQERSEPVYFSRAAVEEKLPELILIEKSRTAINVLKQSLGEKLLSATPVVIGKLTRQRNIREWESRPPLELVLPPQAWLTHRSSDLGEAKSRLGLPTDWSQPGGAVTILHQQKFLCKRELVHPEIAFTIVCEVPEDSLNQLWDNLSEEAWSRLSQHWQKQVEEMVIDLAEHSENELDETVRLQLLKHLERSRHPESSYFANSMLFKDLKGELYSLSGLIKSAAHGWTLATGPDLETLEALPLSLQPRAVWFANNSPEVATLQKVKNLEVKNLNFLFSDLRALRMQLSNARSAAAWRVEFQAGGARGWVEVTPWETATLQVRSHGLSMGTEAIQHAFGFQALVESDELRYNVRLDLTPLGDKRWVLLTNQQHWKEIRQACLQAAAASLKELARHHQLLAQAVWKDWPAQMLLRQLGEPHPELKDIPCLQGRSLNHWLAQDPIYWCSCSLDRNLREAFEKKYPGQALWSELNPSQQVLYAQYGGHWECLDSWLAQQSRFAQFLTKPPLLLGRRDAWLQLPLKEPLQGGISLCDPRENSGCIQWTYQQRLVHTETGLPAGLIAQAGSPELELDESMTRLAPLDQWKQAGQLVREQMTEALEQWLEVIRPGHAYLISFWVTWEVLSKTVAQRLRKQPWWTTHRGTLCWDDLIREPEVWLVEESKDWRAAQELLAEHCLLDASLVPSSLTQRLSKAVEKCHQPKQTRAAIEARQRLRESDRLKRLHSERMASRPYRVSLEDPFEGEFAWVARQAPEVILLRDGRAVELVGAPPGWTGYLSCESARLRLVSAKGLKEEQAELGNKEWQLFYRQVAGVVIERVEAGHLQPIEVSNLAAFALNALHRTSAHKVDPEWQPLVEARWIPCADGTRTSLQQLFLETEEQGALHYWPHRYKLTSQAGLVLTPILSTPVLKELVTRWTGKKPLLRQKPLLYRDVRELTLPKVQSMRQVLEGLARWIGGQATRPLQAIQEKKATVGEQASRVRSTLMSKIAEPVLQAKERQREALQQLARSEEERQADLEKRGGSLMKSLRTQASQLLSGRARTESLKVLERARWSLQKGPSLWTLGDNPPLLLHGRHPLLEEMLEQPQIPQAQTLSLLLALVSAINARSQEFTDKMEVEFLDRISRELVQTYKDLIPESR